ncbi:MAG: flavodoxin family protein [Oscillospiraceae bacterium]|nr:flavodoxin family protein [Oscillospiraceae bacterium]
MKVLLVNGSPHKNGCTNRALEVMAETLKSEGVDSEIYWIGNKPIGGCIGCFACVKKKQCVTEDRVNEFTRLAAEYDGFVFGSPVYFSGINGSLMSFLDRVFFSASAQEPHPFRHKPATALVSARRAGTTSALDQIYKYFQHQQMPIVTSRYWNMVHGNTPEEVMQDAEGLQTLRVLARNMAWLLKLKEAGEKAGVPLPQPEPVRVSTNFIR